MTLQTEISWITKRMERRDESLRAIEDDFCFLLPACRRSNWEKSRDLAVFPISLHYVLQCMDFLQWPDEKDVLLTDVEKWCKWNFKRCLDQHGSIRRPVIDILKRVETLARTGPRPHMSSFAIWSRVIRRAIFLDIEDFEESIMHAIKNQEITPSSFKIDEVLTVMDLLLTFIRRQKPSHRLFIRFLNKLVEKTGVIPNGMSLTGVRRQGEHPVGGGGSADVFEGRYRDEVVALKVLRIFQHTSHRSLEIINKEFRKECMIWRQLRHPNILPLLGVDEFTFRPRLAMVSPWMRNGNVLGYLQKNTGVDRLELIKGIALGLRYLHAQNPPVSHGDLRGTNIFVDNRGAPVIADFGMSRSLYSELSKVDSASCYANGSLRWQSPELLDSTLFSDVKPGISTASDVYSFAAVCLEIFTEEAPFPHLRRDVEVITEVVTHQRAHPKPVGKAVERGLSNEIWTLMTECWSRHPSQRPAMRDVVRELHIQEDIPLEDGNSSSILDVDVLSPPASIAMVTPLFSELTRLIARLTCTNGDQDSLKRYATKLKEAAIILVKAEETSVPNFKFKSLINEISSQEALGFSGKLHTISEAAVGLCNLLPQLHVLGFCEEQDIKNIIRMGRMLTRQRSLLMLPAAPYIIDVEDMEKMAGQVHVFIDKAITQACRQLNKMTNRQARESSLEVQNAPDSEGKTPDTTILAGNRLSSNHHHSVATLHCNEKEDLVPSIKRKRSSSPTSVYDIENISPKRPKSEGS